MVVRCTSVLVTEEPRTDHVAPLGPEESGKRLPETVTGDGDVWIEDGRADRWLHGGVRWNLGLAIWSDGRVSVWWRVWSKRGGERWSG